MEPIPDDVLCLLASECPQPPQGKTPPARSRKTPAGGFGFDLQEWIERHKLEVKGPIPYGKGRKWIFSQCPWNPDHKNKSAYIIQFENGNIAAGCRHNSCSHHNWNSLRELVDPEWRSSPSHRLHELQQPDGLIKLHRRRELPDLFKREWVIEGLIPKGGYSVLYGTSGCGKSTFALDLAHRVAFGLDWMGNLIHLPGLVIYIAAEGIHEMYERSIAWCRHHGYEDQEPNILFIEEPINALDKSSIERVIASIVNAVGEEAISLIVVDTLAECFGDGDENNTQDMNAFVHGLRNVSRVLDSTALVIHHCGKNGEYRGSTVLQASCEVMMKLKSNKDDLSLTFDKIRRIAKPTTPILLKRQGVEDGDFVIVPRDEKKAVVKVVDDLSEDAKKLLSVFQTHKGEIKSKVMKDKSGLDKNSYDQARKELLVKRKIEESKYSYYRLVEASSDTNMQKDENVELNAEDGYDEDEDIDDGFEEADEPPIWLK